MAKSKLKRISRTGRLTPEQIRRDQGIRRKVQAELPPSVARVRKRMSPTDVTRDHG